MKEPQATGNFPPYSCLRLPEKILLQGHRFNSDPGKGIEGQLLSPSVEETDTCLIQGHVCPRYLI